MTLSLFGSAAVALDPVLEPLFQTSTLVIADIGGAKMDADRASATLLVGRLSAWSTSTVADIWSVSGPEVTNSDVFEARHQRAGQSASLHVLQSCNGEMRMTVVDFSTVGEETDPFGLIAVSGAFEFYRCDGTMVLGSSFFGP